MIAEAAMDNEIEREEFLTYNISLSIDNYESTTSNIIDGINKAVIIDKNNKVVYLTVSLY